jgi:signal transduction histidine kinase
MAQLEMQARALFKQIVITRRWVADHGGVFVAKLPWVQPNPFLPDAVLTDREGKGYIKENPAMVTKQLSRYAQQEGLYIFHITSLKLFNPDNVPDAFEAAALKSFELGIRTEATAVEKIGESNYYRYMAPLYVERACLDCHAEQGYKTGDIRGAISVSVPMDYIKEQIRYERVFIILGIVVTGLVLILSIFLVTKRLVLTPLGRIQAQMRNFSSAGSRGIHLVHTGDELEELSRTFHAMARSVDEYQTCLQEKIAAATRELTEKNEALSRSYRTKSDFIAQISHELRSPLTAIKGAMDYLSVKLSMRESDKDPDILTFFDTIKRSADRLIRLVNNVLDYERLEMGAFEMRFRNVNVGAAFHEVVTGFLPLAEEKNVSINLTAPDVTAWIDEDRIKQVLTNLLSNALYFSPAGSSIEITLDGRNDSMHAAVEDAGQGIPEQERSEVFKRFYTKKMSGGTGLGLAICKSIIEAHQGEIGVADSSSGGGRVWFKVPLRQKEDLRDEKTASCH